MKKSIVTFVVALATLAVSANTSVKNPVTPVNNGTGTLYNASLNAFCRAIIQGKTDIVKQMIELGENVNQKSLGKTPAMYAARYNKPEILKLLIDNGAKLSAKSDEENYTAKKFAELSNATEALEIIEAASK